VPPATLRPVRRAVFLLLFAALALSSCGGGNDQEDVQSLLDKAFSSSIKSANLNLDATIQVKGSPGLEKPLRITATGPFRTNDGKIPSADVELKIGTDGGGQTITTGFLSTGDRAFVKFQDIYYEQPRAQVAKANASIAQSKSKRGSLRGLGLDPRTWLAEAKDVGEDEIAGVKTRHISGKLDVESVMRNLNEFVRRSGKTLGETTGQTPPQPLSTQDIQMIGQVVHDPTFNVYVGEKDDTIRRLSGKLDFDVPEANRASLGGIQSGSIEFKLEFANVNGDQQIEAPAHARPLSSLTRSLGGSGGLGGIATGTAGGTVPGTGNGNGTGSAPSVPDNANPGSQQFKDYADCLDKARPEDTEALQRCADLLQRP
jgi:hypothetical protein